MMTALRGIEDAKKYSQEMIENIRSELGAKNISPSIGIVTVGSFARREASEQSDLDFFVIKNGQDDGMHEIEILRQVVSDLKIRMPGTSGTFDGVVASEEMVCNIGGNNDDTKKLTQRLLILLEGEWLVNPDIFDDTSVRLRIE